MAEQYLFEFLVARSMKRVITLMLVGFYFGE
jgi:hypothetical protein